MSPRPLWIISLWIISGIVCERFPSCRLVISRNTEDSRWFQCQIEKFLLPHRPHIISVLFIRIVLFDSQEGLHYYYICNPRIFDVSQSSSNVEISTITSQFVWINDTKKYHIIISPMHLCYSVYLWVNISIE